MIQADIVVSGGSFSACAAALAAARTQPDARVLLIEPTDWLGGQATTQGVSAIDNAWYNPGRTLMLEDRAGHYAADYLDFLERLKAPPPGAPGRGMAPDGSSWVSREAYDPRTAAWVLDRMMEEYPNITVLKLTVVKQVATEVVTDDMGSGRRVTGLTLVRRTPRNGYVPFTKFTSEEVLDWWAVGDSELYTKAVETVAARDSARGLVVIEASETGDLFVLSGAAYTIGREQSTEEFDEEGNPPTINENGTQSFVYPFCMGLTEEQDPESELKAPFPGFDDYLAEQTRTFFAFGQHTWERIWTYRRLHNAGAVHAFDTVNLGDVTMQNWFPGNDYPYGTMFLDKAAAAAQASDWMGGIVPAEMAAAEKHAIAWHFHKKARRPFAWDIRLLRGADADNMMGTGTGLSKWPYIRGCRRSVGLENFRITERTLNDVHAPDYDGKACWRYFDSIAIGSYAADIHATHISTGMSPSVHHPAPFYVPYRALTSANVRNLLAAGKAMAQTYITNSSYRLHPIEWASGTAAGTAAAMMFRDGVPSHALLDPEPLREFQGRVQAVSPISWKAFDATPIPPHYGDLLVNDRRPIQANQPFRIEAHVPRAVRARAWADDVELGESTHRANGRVLFSEATLQAVPKTIVVEAYSADGSPITRLTHVVRP
ncbi:MAG: FAD-dependent oxidoreductase [Candidatus Sumerlaeia bacterium]|nr:FAD-dependent oxidoreductase [Candidatus Sumerlaeia bacterium]